MNQSLPDYYSILQLEKDATQEQIKKSYRKLSLLYHPDRTTNNEHIEKYKLINEAYEILRNAEKRNEYDCRFNQDFSHIFNHEDIINNLFGAGSGIHRNHFPSQPNMHHSPFINLGELFGQGNPNAGHHFVFMQQQHPQIQKPIPIIKNITITLQQAYSGFKYYLDVEKWEIIAGQKIFEQSIITIDIPQGIENGEIIILRNIGNKIDENLTGDIKIIVDIIDDNSLFIRENKLNLLLKKNISLKDALCGFSFQFKHLDNNTYTINNPNNNIIVPNYRKTIANLGMKKGEVIGDLIIEFNIIFPQSLTEEKIIQLKNIL